MIKKICSSASLSFEIDASHHNIIRAQGNVHINDVIINIPDQRGPSRALENAMNMPRRRRSFPLIVGRDQVPQLRFQSKRDFGQLCHSVNNTLKYMSLSLFTLIYFGGGLYHYLYEPAWDVSGTVMYWTAGLGLFHYNLNELDSGSQRHKATVYFG